MYQIYKEDGVVNRFLTALDIFEPPGQNELNIWKTDSRFFFLSPHLPYAFGQPHLPYAFGHVKLTGLLLRCSDPTLNQFGKKNSTVLQSNNYADRRKRTL